MNASMHQCALMNVQVLYNTFGNSQEFSNACMRPDIQPVPGLLVNDIVIWLYAYECYSQLPYMMMPQASRRI